MIGGESCKVHLFCLDLPHSDACFVRAYPAERTEAFLDGHNAAFAFLGGCRARSSTTTPGWRWPRSWATANASGPAPSPSCSRTTCPRPLRPARQGQRQGQGRGPRRLRPARLPGPDPEGGRASPSSTPASNRVPRPAVRSAARPRRERRRGLGATWTPCSRGRGAAGRCDHPPARASALPSSLRPQRLVGADVSGLTRR